MCSAHLSLYLVIVSSFGQSSVYATQPSRSIIRDTPLLTLISNFRDFWISVASFSDDGVCCLWWPLPFMWVPVRFLNCFYTRSRLAIQWIDRESDCYSLIFWSVFCLRRPWIFFATARSSCRISFDELTPRNHQYPNAVCRWEPQTYFWICESMSVRNP